MATIDYIFILGFLPVIQSLSLTFSTWDKRCFIEDIPDSTLITYKYELRLFDQDRDVYASEPSPNSKMLLNIEKLHGAEDGSGAIKVQKDLKNGKGKLSYYAEDYGEYKLCLTLLPSFNDQYEFTTGNLTLVMERKFSEDEHESVEETKDMIVNRLTNNLRKLKQIQSEQKYYKTREQEFRALSYRTSTRVIWYGLLTAITVVSAGLFMMQNMKAFFISKKLV